MLHSPYLVTKLRLYTPKGRSRLDNLLAKMGVSIEHAKQAWTHTPRELKKALKDKLEKAQTPIGLELVQGKEFERAWGYKGTWSACDVVQVIEAILVSVEETGKENISPLEAKDESPAGRFRQREGEMKAAWVTRFWTALDAINKSPPLSSELTSEWIYSRRIYHLQNTFIERSSTPANQSLKNAQLNLYDPSA